MSLQLPVPPERPYPVNKRWLIRQISAFANLTDAELDFVAERSRVVEYEKDEIIYAQGDPPNAFFGVVSGRVRVFIPTATGTQTLQILHRGDYFGTVSLLTNEPHSVTAQAINDSLIIRIPRANFEEILNRIPTVAVHLSATLSRRLRQKDVPSKQVLESIIVSIYGPLPETGKTWFAINLAASISKETGKHTILLDISPTGEAVCRALGVTRCPVPLRLKGVGFNTEKVHAALVHHPTLGFDTLNISHDPNVISDVTQVSPLLSYLANLYGFVLVDLPHEMDRTVFKAMVQADYTLLVSNGTRSHLEATAKVLEELQTTIQQAATRVRVVVNETEADLHPLERQEILNHPIYATLPKVPDPSTEGHPTVLSHPDWEYAKAVRRIGRDLGGVLVGLALGSGAAMGLAHIGVLKVIEEEKIPIDVVAGSSIGALVGVFWAAGFDAQQLRKIASEFRTKRSLLKLVDPCLIPKFGILHGGQVTHLLRRYLGEKTFKDLRLPVKVVACDYARREVVILDEGPVVSAVRASVSIPGIFTPIRLRGRYLVDGGILCPVPVEILAGMGVRKIIAVNVLPSPNDIARRGREIAEEYARLRQEAKSQGKWKILTFHLREGWQSWLDTTLFNVIMHSMQGMEYVLAEAACLQADVVLTPTLPRVNWWEFYSVEDLIRKGEQEAERHLDEIRHLVSEWSSPQNHKKESVQWPSTK